MSRRTIRRVVCQNTCRRVQSLSYFDRHCPRYIFKDVDSTVIPVRAIVLARERFVKKEYFLGHGRPASACALCVPRSPSLFEERLPYHSSCSADLGNFLLAKLEWIVREARRRDEEVPRTVSCESRKIAFSLAKIFFSSSSSSSSFFHYEKSSMNKEYGDFSRVHASVVCTSMDRS